MAVGSKCKPLGWQVADLSPIGAAPTTGVLDKGKYRLFISSATDSTQTRDQFNAHNSFKRDQFNAHNLVNPQLFVDNFMALTS